MNTSVRLAFVVGLCSLAAWAEPPPGLINYQGRLLEGTNLVNGVAGLSVRLYNVPAGGSVLYEDSNAVTVVDGLYATFIGDQTNAGDFASALTNAEVYIAVAINGGPELSPRERIASVAYSLNADRLDGLSAEQFALGADLTTEQAARVAEDAALSNAVAAEAVARAAADASLAAADASLSNAVAAETAARVAAAAALSNAVGLTWSLAGNTGTTAGTHFLGTTDKQAFDIRTFNQRIARFDTATNAAGVLIPNVILGHSANLASNGTAFGSVIGGGGNAGNPQIVGAAYDTIAGGVGNRATGGDSTVAGGRRNTASGLQSFVGGGGTNIASGAQSVIGGGQNNRSLADRGVVAGGRLNEIQSNAIFSVIGGGELNTVAAGAAHAVVGGGYNNNAGGLAATVPGGQDNDAANTLTFAAGNRAKALHPGAFVWGDASDEDIASINANSVTMRATGGYRLFTETNNLNGAELPVGGGSWITFSDRSSKENITPVNPREIVEKVAALPVATWNYKSQDPAVRHIGPMAQDFHATFGVGERPTGITSVDADGVALAAIQGLYQIVKEQQRRIEQLEAELHAVRAPSPAP